VARGRTGVTASVLAMGDPAAAAVPRRVDVLALSAAYFTVGVTVSVAVVGIGTPAWLTLLVAVTAYSATSELAFVAVMAAGGSLPAALVSGWLVASRFGLLATSLGLRLSAPPAERAAAALVSVDPNVALAIAQPDAPAVRTVYWRVSAWLVGGWVSGSVVGVVLGNVLGDPRTWGLDAVFPAALLAIVSGLLRRRDAALTAVVGAGLCLALIPLVPAGLPILVAVSGAVLGLAVAPRPVRGSGL
jgi:predicted branched-subunit amino acid permease